MAEKGSPTDEAASNTPTMAEIASGLMLGQSKSTGEQFLGFSELEQPRDGKNKMVLVCQQCRSRVLKPGYGTLVDKELFLPSVMAKHEIGSEPGGDQLTSHWLVVDMFHFENIGFSNTVNAGDKYLVCADCEVGPIGWSNVNNKCEYYVAADRVHYANS